MFSSKCLYFCFFYRRYPWDWFEITIKFFINVEIKVIAFGSTKYHFSENYPIRDPITLRPNTIPKIARKSGDALYANLAPLDCESRGGGAGNEGW